MTYRLTDRFENWFTTSLQTDVNDTTTSFRLNKALNVHQGRLVINPYDEDQREIVKVTSVDGTLVYVELGDDNTTPQYHLEGTIVAMHVFAADINDLYADFAGVVDDITAAAFLAAHPVGSTYWNETVSTNPGSIYGGTWVALEGVVLGGRSEASGSPFNVAAGTIIGEDEHTLTVDELASHDHTQSSHTHTVGGSGFMFMGASGNIAVNGTGRAAAATGGAGWHYVYANSAETINEYSTTNSSTPAINNTGGDSAHNNIQRTLVGYLWKRTA